MCNCQNTCKTRQPIKQFGPKLPVLIPLSWWGKATSLFPPTHTPHPQSIPPGFVLPFRGISGRLAHTHTPQKLIDIQLVGFPAILPLPLVPVLASFVARLRFGFAATRYALICSAAQTEKAWVNILRDIDHWLWPLRDATSCWPSLRL